MGINNILVKESTTITEGIQTISEGEYPESDGQPMGETGFHVMAMFHLLQALRQLFRECDDVYSIANMFLYYEEGNPHACKAPDVMVIRGVENSERRTFKTWEEGAMPCVIIEITSKSTMLEDMVNKSSLYASLGVKEYFLFDPLKEYLTESALLGFRLEDKEYVAVPSDEKGFVYSEQLKTFLWPEESILRVIDPYSGKPIPALDEAILLAEQEAYHAKQEAQRADQEAQRAAQEAQRAAQETLKAQQEKKRAEAAEAELQRLKALLAEKESS